MAGQYAGIDYRILLQGALGKRPKGSASKGLMPQRRFFLLKSLANDQNILEVPPLFISLPLLPSTFRSFPAPSSLSFPLFPPTHLVAAFAFGVHCEVKGRLEDGWPVHTLLPPSSTTAASR